MRDARCEMRDVRCEVRGARCETWDESDARWEMRYARWEIRDEGCEMQDGVWGGGGDGAVRRDATRDARRATRYPTVAVGKSATLERGGGGSYPAGSVCVPDGHIATLRWAAANHQGELGRNLF